MVEIRDRCYLQIDECRDNRIDSSTPYATAALTASFAKQKKTIAGSTWSAESFVYWDVVAAI